MLILCRRDVARWEKSGEILVLSCAMMIPPKMNTGGSDGKEVEESYRYIVPNKITHGTITAEYSLPITVGEGQVFVMGDNRNNSADSRSQAIGLVDERCIVGKAIVRLLPFDRFTVFKNPFGN